MREEGGELTIGASTHFTARQRNQRDRSTGEVAGAHTARHRDPRNPSAGGFWMVVCRLGVVHVWMRLICVQLLVAGVVRRGSRLKHMGISQDSGLRTQEPGQAVEL